MILFRKRIDPVPHLVATYSAANLWSTALLIGNPTNMIVGKALDLSFVKFIVYFGLPALAAGITSFSLLFLVYIRQLGSFSLALAEADISSGDISAGEEEEVHIVSNIKSAVLGVSILLITLVLLIIGSFVGLDVWIVSLGAGITTLIKDLIFDVIERRKQRVDAVGVIDEPPSQSLQDELVEISVTDTAKEVDGKPSSPQIKPTIKSKTWKAIKEVPWKFIICIFVLFIEVEALDVTGWIGYLATGFHRIPIATSSIALAVIMSLLNASIMAIGNNQPMTILLVRVFMHNNFTCDLTPVQINISLMSLVIASNLGPNILLSGAVGGLLWLWIAKTKELKTITYFYFFRISAPISLCCIIVSSLILSAEVLHF